MHLDGARETDIGFGEPKREIDRSKCTRLLKGKNKMRFNMY
jgi:hypothetical protein